MSGARYGIFMDYRGYGATEIDNGGNIAAAMGSGIHLAHNNNGTVTLTNSGDVDAATVGLRLEKRSGTGAVAFTNSGRVTVTADAAAGAGHALWLTEGAGVTGAVTITNRGVLRSKNHALYAQTSAANTADLTLTNSGAVASADGDGIRLARGVEGDVTVTNSADVSGRWHGVYVGRAARIDFDQTAGTISGRTGVYAEVSSASASGDTRSTDSDGNHIPAIDVAWTGGSIARGTAANDQGRFRAASAAQALAFDQEAATVKAVAESVRWGGPAGIEAHALSWRDVAAQVAKGDDPFAIADNAAQMNLLSTTHADSRRAAILAQFRAALGNADLAVAAAVFEAIDSTATSLADVTDAEIVTYLSTDDVPTRALLRNVLAQGLSDKEKAVLRAVAAGDAAALTIALNDADAGFPSDYKAAVQALLARHHLDDIRIAMSGGSIDSRGDGIRTYYATPNDDNGGISVTVAEGAEVTGGMAGIYVANAGPGLMLARKYRPGFGVGIAPGEDPGDPDELVAVMHGEGADAVALRNQLVTVAGTVTGGTDAAVRLSGGGGVLVMEGGRVHAGASGVGIGADGPALVYVDGEVRGGEGGAAAVHLSGGGSVTVGPNGRVQAGGAGHAIQGGATPETRVALTLVTDRLVLPYRDDVNAQVDGSLAGVASVHLREYRNRILTGYSQELRITADGRLDTSKLPSRPEPPAEPPLPTEPPLSCPEAADGRCIITQAGTITGRTGVYAAVPRASEPGETRAAADQPLIDVTWTGTFSHAEGSNDRGRFAAATVAEVLAFDRESAAGKAEGALEGSVRYGGAAGIEAHALSWRDVAAQVAKGDDPGAINRTMQTTAVPAGATASDNAYVKQFKAALGNDEIEVAPAVLTEIDSTATTAAELTDEDIVTYLRTDHTVTRALLRHVLVQGLSDKEKAVLRAVATGDDASLATALDDADAGFSDAYKTAVRALLDRYNVGDIRIAMTAGSIDSRGDGIRAYYATPHAMNGGIRVDVAKDTTVTGGKAGIYVANAGPGLMLARKYTPGYAEGDDPDELVAVTHGEDAVPLLDQLVTVAGTVTGGTDAAVHLNGGGAVVVMAGGEVHAGSSGVGILVNDPGPAVVHVDGEVKGGEGGAAAVHLTGGGSVIIGLNGKVEANDADRAIRGGGTAATTVDVILAAAGMIVHREDADEAYNARVEGSLKDVDEVRFREHRNGVFTGYSSKPVPVGDNGMLDLDASGLPERDESEDDGSEDNGMTLKCKDAPDDRCRLYEALPSVLVAMNALPSWAERTSAARDGNGGWARVEAAGGDWQAKKATRATAATPLAYDHRRSAVRAGVDFHAGESARVGVSVHALGGKAEMGGVGEVELDGMGGGLSATWLVGDFYVDAQAAVTLYDVDVESDMFGKMPKKDVHGAGYGLGVDVGRRMAVGGMSVTPRAGVEWSKVDLDEFVDMEREDSPEARARVSVEEADSVKGRVGVMVEAEMGSGETSGRLFASLDVEQEFSEETEVQVGRELLKTEVRPTAVRVGLGGAFAVAEDVVVRATGGFRTSGSGTSGYGGGLELQMRF